MTIQPQRVNWWAVLAVLALCAVGAVAGFGLAIRYAHAHDAQRQSDWIGEGKLKDPVSGQLCRGLNDCRPVPVTDVIELPGGAYRLALTGEVIPEARVQRSRDGRYWVCRYPDRSGQPTGPLRCFFAPPSTS